MARREEVLNVVLAQCICESGMAADPENILKNGLRRDMPDVIVSLHGLRCVIEGKIDDVEGADAAVAADVDDRLEHAIAHVAIGVVYPARLRSAVFDDLARELRTATLRFTVRTEPGQGGWRRGTVDDVLADLRRAHELLTEEDVLARSVNHLEIGMTNLVAMLVQHEPAVERLSDVLGVREPGAGEDEADADGEE